MKPLPLAAVISGLVFVLWIIGRITLIFQFFSVTTSANQPTLRPGRFFFTSSLKKPKRLRYICYHAITPETGPAVWTHRLCGLPGDTIEIKAGVLYVNGKNEDKSLSLMHIYRIDKRDTVGIVFDRNLAYTVPPYPDTIYASMEDSYVRNYKLPCDQYILPPGIRDEDIFRMYKKNWNRDNFGPLRVPPKKFFVLGDNRENTLDSRYMGFVDQLKYMGTVLWK